MYRNVVLSCCCCLDICLCYQSEIFAIPFYPQNHRSLCPALSQQSPCWQEQARIRELMGAFFPLNLSR